MSHRSDGNFARDLGQLGTMPRVAAGLSVADDGDDLSAAVAVRAGPALDLALSAASGAEGLGGLRGAGFVFVAGVSVGHAPGTRKGGVGVRGP